MLVVLLLVAYTLLRTRIGKATRAVSDNRALAAGDPKQKVLQRLRHLAQGGVAGDTTEGHGGHGAIRCRGAGAHTEAFGAASVSGLVSGPGVLLLGPAQRAPVAPGQVRPGGLEHREAGLLQR